ncbi:hypothetical protein E3E22_06450 [Thermococcus sp. MV5]|uniref:hypothetical protein n=1 Tax=Thermococcus sp. MV5 TaxID=1638272 RepID=UPI00143B25A0|nr:hypothetical protein [Thermococcus sp. MV5]NJE26265.1 hypothetical protein [Thermococcus sp. MV5]
MSEETTKKRELIKEAYRFGYFVGYRGHTEWISWVSKKKGEIYEKAKLFGIYNEVRTAYEKGIEDGKARRLKEVELGLSKLESEIIPESTKKVTKTQEKEEIEEDYQTFAKTPKIMEPPEILKLIKSIEAPKMLSLPKMLDGEE